MIFIKKKKIRKISIISLKQTIVSYETHDCFKGPLGRERERDSDRDGDRDRDRDSERERERERDTDTETNR